MKMKRSAFLGMILLLMSCTVNDSSFIHDPFDPRLPQYSEEGANTAAAVVDGGIWKSRKAFNYGLYGYYDTSGDIRFNYYHPDSTDGIGTLIIFEKGVFQRDGVEQKLSIGFFIDKTIQSPDDLNQLEGLEIQLDGLANFGQAFLNSDYPQVDSLHKGIGKLIIRDIGINETDNIYISGTFGFKMPEESTIREVYSGRFDYEVGDENFFELIE
jgi:hypothetical protein